MIDGKPSSSTMTQLWRFARRMGSSKSEYDSLVLDTCLIKEGVLSKATCTRMQSMHTSSPQETHIFPFVVYNVYVYDFILQA